MNTIFKIPGLKSLAASGMLLGGGVAFLTLNERRGVAAEKLRLLAEFQATSLIETDVENVDPSLDGKLLHYQGMLRPDIPPADHMFGVSGKELLAIRRTVEMYQWKEHKVVTKNKDTKEETTKYTYSKVWSPFHLQTEGDIDKKNPMFPSDLEGGIRLFLGNGIHLGTSDKLVLSQELLDQMTDYKPLALSREFLRQDGEPFPHNLQLNRTRSGLSSGKGLLSDNIGDLRVTFEGVYTGPYSALAKLSYATDKTRHLTPWVASLKQSLASEGPVEMPKNLDDLLGYSLDSFVIPEPVIAWAETVLLSLAPLHIAYLTPGRKGLKACMQGVEAQDLKTLNSLRATGFGIVLLGVCSVMPSAMVTTSGGFIFAAITAAVISYKTIEDAKPRPKFIQQSGADVKV